MRALLTNARISPKKANLIAGLVRGKKVNDALTQLKFTAKKGAKILSKVIHSALSNAINTFEQKSENLVIKSLLITKGVSLKRGIPISRGRYHPLVKRNSNITVEIGVQAEEPLKKEEAKEKETKILEKKTVPKKEKNSKKTKKTNKAHEAIS